MIDKLGPTDVRDSSDLVGNDMNIGQIIAIQYKSNVRWW